jgi:hypothetical protein
LAEHEDRLARVVETLKEPVELDSRLNRRVMSAIEQLPPHASSSMSRSRALLSPRWTIRLSPLGGLAAAAGIAALALTASLLMQPREESAAVVAIQQDDGPEVTQFVLVAPGAESVALVGDFNDWNLSATRLARQAGEGVWWVTVSLPPGRYRYAFVVDGTAWRSDPNAPLAEDEFGRPNSVVTIGGA